MLSKNISTHHSNTNCNKRKCQQRASARFLTSKQQVFRLLQQAWLLSSAWQPSVICHVMLGYILV